MTVSIISITENGLELSLKLAEHLSEKLCIKRYAFYKKCDEKALPFSNINQIAGEIFSSSKVIIFVCACGIAVRTIAPFIKSKTTDPAVIVIDDNGRFVIPVLSGHLGCANRLSEIIAEKIDAVPVITTATDIGGKFSPDSVAKANNLIISNLSAAKEIAAAVLNNEKIGLVSDYECVNIPSDVATNEKCRTGICISADITEKPFEITLNLIPKNIVIGIGCKRGTSCTVIEEHIADILKMSEINENRLCAITTIDIKADEKGILEFCEKHSIKMFTYTADELMNVEGNFTKSEFVFSQTGTDNVCERSVVKYGGKLIIPKTAENGTAVAVAEIPVEIDFARNVL